MLDVLPSSSLSWLRRLPSTWCWASLMVLPYCRFVATRYGSIDALTATQFFINATRFFHPRDIGTSGHWNPESKHPGHWNFGDIGTPSALGGERAPTREPERARTRGTVFFCSGTPLTFTGGLSRCAFHCQAAHGCYDVLGGARWLRYSFWSPFSRDS